MAKQWTTPPEIQINPKKQYKAHMETDKGTMVIELFADKTPMTVNNFVFLSREGFYDGVIFHRVIDNFMVQGSQFFITHGPTPHLNGKHTVFGQVVEGLDVLMSIPARDPGNVNAPAVKIIRVTIEEI